ncbi:alpha-N-arabinofuranosidase [Saccharothrix lopnurensis]|uniref:non-reducing end alpha-L-arabinofuranosidase n=1 Tax=Saccharothrix lopnurensis TaxID=1670621 RepID=A0ABW1P7L7_9PSEU
MTATLAYTPDHVLAPVRRRLFGSFVEHLGRCVHTGIHEPDHPTADEDGFRGDVLALTRELGVELVRYPGGNFVSGYRWEDGIGPHADRPVRRDPAWRSIETNQVGIDEFARWARKADVEIMYAINLGTRGVAEALDVHEYLNHPGGTHLSDLRRANGTDQPHDVRLWCLGNELDGPWQTGHKTAHEYGRLAAETARALRQAEPDLELVACGSSHSRMPTFGQWESTVLELCYDLVDHISLHAYYDPLDDDVDSFLASAVDMDRFIDRVVATADAVGARLKSDKRITLSFDEWNVWYLSRFQADPPTEWRTAPPLIEDTYDVTDAVVVGNLLISLLRHADRVAAACQAQLVNAIAPIRTEPGGPAWRQTTFHPFALTSRLARGHVLHTSVHAPTTPTTRYGDVPVVDAVATHDHDGTTTVFAVNRHRTQPVELHLPPHPAHVTEAWLLHDQDPTAVNTAHHPDRVQPRPLTTDTTDGRPRAVLPPVSWCAITLRDTPAP